MNLVGTSLHNGKRILIPLLYDYYIFSYFKKLVKQLVDDNFDVTIVTLDKKVFNEYSEIDGVTVVMSSRWLRFLLNRSGKLFFRFLLWGVGWGWGHQLKKKYDFAIVPWDNKPLWYIISKLMPSLTCHNSTEYLDFDLTLEHMHLSEKQLESKGHKVMLMIDKIFRGKFLPKVNGEILYYSFYVIIDRLMGFRAPNYLAGFSSVDYMSVTGTKIKKNLQDNGVDKEKGFAEIIVTGSPSYEGIIEIKDTFNEIDKSKIFEQYGLSNEQHLYSFFLSPSSFTEEQIEEVANMVEIIREEDKSSAFLLKFHPKTRKGDPARFQERLVNFSDDLIIITQYSGDEENAKLILASKCTFQKQGTVGFIAMLYNAPLISYDLIPTDYFDDMYKIIDGSFHCQTEEELVEALQKIETKRGLQELSDKQKRACNEVCYPASSPCYEISKIIQKHFDE